MTAAEHWPAHSAVRKAIIDGVLPRPETCEECGRKASRANVVVYHHWSYLPEHRLDVIPLCSCCHIRLHAGHFPEPRTGRVYPIPKHHHLRLAAASLPTEAA